MAERDPRVDPKPGDILERCNYRYSVSYTTKKKVILMLRKNKMQATVYWTREHYLDWANTATVIFRSEL